MLCIAGTGRWNAQAAEINRSAEQVNSPVIVVKAVARDVRVSARLRKPPARVVYERAGAVDIQCAAAFDILRINISEPGKSPRLTMPPALPG